MGVHIDTVRFDPPGIAAVDGWTTLDLAKLPAIELFMDGEPLRQGDRYRRARPDVNDALGVEDPFLGLSIEFLFDGTATRWCELRVGGNAVWAQWVACVHLRPDYVDLFSSPRVVARDHIYGSGPPSEQISSETLALFTDLPAGSRVLDLGCGRGTLVRHLRERGHDAVGIEIDRPEIRSSIVPELAELVTLYDGALPLPFGDAEFDCVVMIEVLEHVADPLAMLAEAHRVARERFIVSVPDCSAIPRLHRHQVVPWHLLESTHLQFFSLRSLDACLEPLWSTRQLVKLGRVIVNDTSFDVSVAASCTGKVVR